VADLTFASVVLGILHANVKSKATLALLFNQRPFGSDIRKRGRRKKIRMSEPGRWFKRNGRLAEASAFDDDERK